MSGAWLQLVLVMAGGALGAAARFLIGGWLLRVAGGGFPWGTLAVNLLGSFAAGVLLVWLEGRGGSAPLWRAFLMVGLLGALTTYSALMLELFLLQRSQGLSAAAGYLLLSLVAGIGLFWLGLRAAEAMQP
jgi:fluoride exporter